MKVECCDNCKKPFEPFEMDNGEIAYGMIPDDDGELEYLMSDLTQAWFCFTEKEPERHGELQYLCINCVGINEEE